MSQDVVNMVMGMRRNHWYTQLILQCAPVLTGIKVSNLLIIQKRELTELKQLLLGTVISTYILGVHGDKVAVLLYRQQELSDYLNDETVVEMLHRLGYENQDILFVLEELAIRYQQYMENRYHFPHEMGFVLGYPISDVIGFMEHEGENYLYKGYWKVYGNVAEAVAQFEAYNHARELLIRMVYYGANILDVLHEVQRLEAVN